MAISHLPEPREPAPRTAIAGRVALPRPLTPLVARERDTAAVAALLHDPDTRLLTLTGPGGVGKTRLAIAAAETTASDFPGGVAFVDLSAVRDADLVSNAIAACLGLRDTSLATPHERVLIAIADRRLLLVLDNFEQVVVAAPRLRDLLDACPATTVLVTSRIRLRISGEREYPVAPLSLDGDASEEDREPPGAVRLFIDRARAIRPDFHADAESLPVVTEIVRRVDGLPLAIELAAARVRALPPTTLLARLEQRLPLLSGGTRDLPLRQQTMRDTIGWSHDLLDTTERTIFRRLGVFLGGFTLDAAEAILAGPGDDPMAVLDGITALIEHSLLLQSAASDTEARYQMLETVSEFARDRLAAADEADDMRRRHANYYLALAEMIEPALTGPDQASWLDRLGREKDNLHAALRRSLEQGEVATATRLGAALWRFWERRWHLDEGRSLLAAIIALPAGVGSAAARCAAITGAAALAALQGDYEEAVRHGEEALAGWRRLGNQRGIAQALLGLAIVARYRDDYAAAEALGAESLGAFLAIDDRWGAGHALANLGMVAWVQGDHATGTARYEDALAHLRAVGDQAGIFEVLLELGKGARDAADLDRATALFDECLALTETTGDRPGRGAVLTELGVVARLRVDHAGATTLLLQATALAREHGDRRQLSWLAAHLGDVNLAAGDIGAAARRYAEALGLYLPMGNRVGIAQSLAIIARCAAMRGQAAPAIRLLGGCAALFDATGATPPPDRDPTVIAESFRSMIDPAEFTAAWDAGLALTPEDAATEALALAAALATAENGADAPPSLVTELGLTPREVEILGLLAEGMSDREIATTLSISERTAGNHVQHAMQKIGVESRTAAAVFAVRNNLA